MYAFAPGYPGRWRASCALTDLHTHSRNRRRRWHTPHSSGDCSTHTTLYRHEQRGTYGGYINGPVCVVGSTLAVP